MKKHTLLVIGLGTLLTITGCKSPGDRVTHLPSMSTTGDGLAGNKSGLDLNTPPLDLGNKSDAANGGNITSDLADESSLTDREFDRAAFANQTVLFEYDKSTVRAGEASKVDQVIAEFKTKGLGYDLLIEGHCDERGTEEYNRSLGERRALAIRELLMQSGIDGKHVFTRTFGKDKPASTGHDEASRARNRRGEFVLVLPKKLLTTQNTK
jgi:outer membrane protein OmpA-like peptidoglycan-associated protein